MSDGNFTAESAAQHQAELNDYLQSKSINQLFVQLVESLLIEKPDNPIGFVVEFLQKKYPEQSGRLTPQREQLERSERPEMVNVDEGEDEDDDVEDEDSNNGPIVPYNKERKRDPVCAEIVRENQDDVKEVKKTEDELLRIVRSLQRQLFFKHLEKEQIERLACAMSVVEYKSGDFIIKQGEDGDHFYLVDRGTVECFKREQSSDQEQLIHTYTSGGVFGELAIMYNAPRAVTCRAACDCRLHALDRKALKIILMKTSIEKRSQIKSFLQNVDILKQLTEYEFLTLADSMVENAYEDGDVICRQGDAGFNFYIIRQGTVACSQVDAQGNHREVARLSVGDYFGEMALMASKPRQATVVAAKGSGMLKLLSLDRNTFNRLLGSIEDILRRNMSAYNKFHSAQI